MLRTIPIGYAIEPLSQVDALLASVERDHHAKILIAIESGSRAWGFPSPDSDYDCRFIYVRWLTDYLSPWTPRDVIETPMIGDMDVNGWDLGKALKLMLKGNAVIIEWLMSPIIYRGDPEFRNEMLSLANAHTDREAIGRHYLHLGLRQRNTYFADGKDIALKKLFYALRPAAALRWMRLHPTLMLPPMHFPTLLTQCDPPAPLVPIVEDLLARKALTKELGTGDLPEPVRHFIDSEFDLAASARTQAPTGASQEARLAVSQFYAKWVTAFGV